MKTTEIHENGLTHGPNKLFNTARLGKQMLVMIFGTLLALGTTLNAPAVALIPMLEFGCVPDKTINLFTAPMTTTERQALHAQNQGQHFQP